MGRVRPDWYAWGVSAYQGAKDMAKRKEPKVPAIKTPKTSDRVAIRLELKRADHKRLEQQAENRDLSLASMARVAVLEWLKQQEGGQE